MTAPGGAPESRERVVREYDADAPTGRTTRPTAGHVTVTAAQRPAAGTTPTDLAGNPEPWNNPVHGDGTSQRVYALIFEALTYSITLPLDQRARVARAIYERLRTSGAQITFADGLAALRAAARQHGDTTP